MLHIASSILARLSRRSATRDHSLTTKMSAGRSNAYRRGISMVTHSRNLGLGTNIRKSQASYPGHVNYPPTYDAGSAGVDLGVLVLQPGDLSVGGYATTSNSS